MVKMYNLKKIKNILKRLWYLLDLFLGNNDKFYLQIFLEECFYTLYMLYCNRRQAYPKNTIGIF